tara:strand:- start:114 stop:419 length:306 start_codon:yes stop_codon:yes gene_type:complete
MKMTTCSSTDDVIQNHVKPFLKKNIYTDLEYLKKKTAILEETLYKTFELEEFYSIRENLDTIASLLEISTDDDDINTKFNEIINHLQKPQKEYDPKYKSIL